MNRRWVQATFRISSNAPSENAEPTASNVDIMCKSNGSSVKVSSRGDTEVDPDIDISDNCLVSDMFGISLSTHEQVEISVGNLNFKIKVLSKEHQHTCKSNGLMQWESAHLMATVLENNPVIVSGKRVLELGCGCGA